MKLELSKARQTLIEEVRSHTADGNLTAIASLAPKLKELDRLETELADLEHRLTAFHSATPKATRDSHVDEQSIKAVTRIAAKSNQTRLRITIRWSALGKAQPDEVIQEHFANLTQAKFLGRLVNSPGVSTTQKLMQFARSQGGRMHVSEHPDTDPNFINQVNGVPYAYKPIPGTKLFLLTNTSTQEKKEDLELFLTFAGVPLSAFEVEVIDK